jgi:glyoxylase-like metal-dependent hydrolase (beta-lactamase superfamily II)
MDFLSLALVMFQLRGAAATFQPWINGAGAQEPEAQVQRYDRDTFVIRQSVKTNFEAPFLYLLFGQDRVLLLDSGAGGLKIRPVVDEVIEQWLAEQHRTSIPLVVAHSHGHGDHHQGDIEFKERPRTVVVGLTPAEVAAFFRIADWPNEIVKFDLGDRTLHVIPTPGHEPAHIMLYDERDQLLLSGDSLYPGRLYVPVNRFEDFVSSIDRVAEFTRGHPVKWILGAHIEMTRAPGKDFADFAAEHPDEHVLQLPLSVLLELQSALQQMGHTASHDVHKDFIIVPRPPR